MEVGAPFLEMICAHPCGEELPRPNKYKVLSHFVCSFQASTKGVKVNIKQT